MAGLDPANQQANVCEPINSLRPQTRARWVGGSSPPMVTMGQTDHWLRMQLAYDLAQVRAREREITRNMKRLAPVQQPA